MSTTSARAQLVRLLTLAPYLQRRGGVSLRELAADFGVTPEQMLGDLRVLFLCGLPGFGPGELIDINVEALEDDPDGAVTIANADYLARPLRLGSNEASALIVALRALLDSGTESSRDVVERTLEKLEAAVEEGSTPLVDVRGTAAAPTAAALRSELAEAIGNDRQVRLTYLVPARDESTDRVVDPVALLRRDGHDYLDAWCHLAGARRIFRLDRIVDHELLPTARTVPDLTPREVSADLFEAGPEDLVARLRLRPELRWFAEYYPVLSTQELPGGDLEVELAVSDERWLLRLALRSGSGLEVLAPAGLRDRVAVTAREALRLQRGTAYDDPVGTSRTE